MAPQFGRLTTQLSEQTILPDDRFCEEINRLIAPSAPLTPDRIYVAAMFLVSDQVNSFGGRFPADEHQRLAELLVDSPVLVGHRKDSLPIARNFRAELVERGSERWVKSYFYWPRDSQGAESLKANIDGGLYKECSIAFTYNLPECSVCGDDIRNCEHEPGERYSGDSVDSVCHFNYRQIEPVLESSLVYRGAVPNTLVTTEGLNPESSEAGTASNLSNDGPRLVPVTSIESVARDRRYLVVSRYDGIPVLLSSENGSAKITRFDRKPLSVDPLFVPSLAIENPDFPLVALLVGLQGRRRCSRREVEQYLAGKSSRMTRLVVTAYPDTRLGNAPSKRRLAHNSVRTIPHRIANWSELPEKSAQIATRDGVEIWALGSNPLTDTGYLFSTNSKQAENQTSNCFEIRHSPHNRPAYLTIKSAGKSTHFTLKDFETNQLTPDRFCLADQVESTSTDLGEGDNSRVALRGDLVSSERAGESLHFKVDSPEFSAITIRPVILNRRRRLVVQFQADSRKSGGRHANR